MRKLIKIILSLILFVIAMIVLIYNIGNLFIVDYKLGIISFFNIVGALFTLFISLINIFS